MTIKSIIQQRLLSTYRLVEIHPKCTCTTTDVYVLPITYLDNDTCIYLAIVQLSQSGDSKLVQNDLIGEHLGRDPASITVNNES